MCVNKTLSMDIVGLKLVKKIQLQSGEEIELNQDGKSFYAGFNQLYRLNTYC